MAHSRVFVKIVTCFMVGGYHLVSCFPQYHNLNSMQKVYICTHLLVFIKFSFREVTIPSGKHLDQMDISMILSKEAIYCKFLKVK